MMDIAGWLQGLGLERYEQTFRDNEIDERVLLKLTADDLKELGVNALGHRRLLLDAIAALATGVEPKVESRSPDQPADSRIASAGSTTEAERRQLTVMFCDLVGSTPLASRFDPEDLRELIGVYHRAVTETVGRFAGFVAKYMGDGVLVYFGYPQAHEDDAERAVKAGLAVVEAVRGLNAPEPLAVRLGVATGLVVVGDLIGEGAAQERGVIGETPNLAARLQALADPGSLVISDNTRRQIGGLFDTEDLGPRPLAGFAEAQRAWRVLGESGELSRFEALRSGATPLVGRDEELELLRRRWDQTKAGEGRVVLISGEPGIGKSRLTAAIGIAIEGDAPLRLRWFCSPHHQDSALYPFIAQLERAAGFARGDTPEERLDKLRAVLVPGTETGEDFALLSELLSLPNAAASLNLSPQRKREKLLEAMLRQLESLSRERPVLAAFEDAHWTDPTSRELLDLTVERVRRLPILLVVTFRPEFQHGWGGQPHVTQLGLNRLGERDVTTLVRGLAGNLPLGSDVVEEIVDRTDGVPLFIEELTKAVLERADQENRVAAVLSASPLPALAVPSTLHASLIARLDRIGAAAREVAQIGAVLGREFTYELIEPVAQRGEAELQASLAHLVDAGLLFGRGMPPHASYLFKHALVQDAAYGTLLRTRRQELHTRVAVVLERDFADLVERQPELLAHHLSAAGQTKRAVEQWVKAGQRAGGRLSHVEAIAHLERGLAMLSSLPETTARDAIEIELRLALGVSSITVRGLSSPSVPDAYSRARVLAEKRGDARQLFQATYGLWQNKGASGMARDARILSAELLRLARRGENDEFHLQAHHSAWTTGFFCGELIEAHAHVAEGRRLYDAERHQSHRFIYGGHDPGVCAGYTAAQTGWLLGYPDKAAESAAEALAMADRLAHPLTREVGLEYAAHVHLHRREPEISLAYLLTLDQLRVEQRVSFVIEPAFMRAAVLLAQGAYDDAAAMLRETFAPGRVITTAWQPYGRAVFAESLLRQGANAEALACLGHAFDRVQATGERVWEAELHRIRALALLAQNQIEEGEQTLRHAIRVAGEQQAKSLELRAATSLAQLWGEQGRRTEAQQLLTPVYGSFTEGFDTMDLKEAKALLDALA
jgi:class 3 adenylate cyclase/predicted ATPase